MDDRPLQTSSGDGTRMATEVAIDADVSAVSTANDEESVIPSIHSRLEKEPTGPASSTNLDVAAGATTTPRDDATHQSTEDQEFLSLEQLAVEEIGTMLNSAAASAQATAQAISGSTDANLSNVDDLLADLFGSAPAEGPTATAASESSPPETDAVPTPEPASDLVPEPASESAPEATPELSPEPAGEPESTPEPVASPEADSALQPTPEPLAPAALEPEPVAAVPADAPVETPAEPISASPPVQEALPLPVPIAAAPIVESKPSARDRALAIVNTVLQPVFRPLRALSGPLLKLPPTLRTMVGVFGLTLLLWAPAIWWFGSSLVAADRVRPLTEAELVALTSTLRSGSAEKNSDSHGAEKPKEKPKEKESSKAKPKDADKKADAHH